jgi:hypothetical protein
MDLRRVTVNPFRQSVNVSETGKAGLVCPTKRAILLFLQMDLAKPLCSVSDAGFDFPGHFTPIPLPCQPNSNYV